MKVVGNCTVGELEDGGIGGGGVAIDGGGRTVVKIGNSDDRVIALHVLDPSSDIEGTSSLLFLVKTFDSVLSVYEGFSNLKQVDLKLKVCRGSSASTILVQEAKLYGAGSLGLLRPLTQSGLLCLSPNTVQACKETPKEFLGSRCR